ncbi:Predicted dehydrogenase [Actinopolymorpha cephalotaxi]|uniref:Dehydrogenase n=1 Tax=Actinopolymorpha cephalotaxi TaxID=504797 RepID=A0A1I2ZXM8_9ACTN|nr:Gfo/Idh/MocA family oxidoreductase [Actinopolymorpha cephalotaxi]NYH84221.1 putative dehydrogenase [Actinopolymorpha cephalotaxi]SFH42430.1 Predicted dehydrogenase [Actinopolymorpha cephalotaxi]
MKAAILGAGRMGETVIGHLLDDPILTGLIAYDVRAERTAELAARYPIEVTTELRRVLDDPQVRVVFVTASNDAHAELSLAALAAGKAVMCEKPMAARLEDAAAMARTAHETAGFLQVGFELRYSRLYTTVKQWIDEGLLGDVLAVNCTYVPGEFWGRDSWRTQATSGGMFGEKLSHYVDLPRWWTGSEVTEVYSASAPNAVPYFQVRDNYQTTCRFGTGAVGHLSFLMALASTTTDLDPLQDMLTQQRGDGHELRYLVQGTKGAAETDIFGRSIKRWAFEETRRGLDSSLVEQLTWALADDHTYLHNTTEQARDVVRRVRDGRPPSIAPDDALQTMFVCAAAELSSDEGRPVRLEDIAALGNAGKQSLEGTT